MTEDVYMETINALQADRMRLRGKDMLQRLAKLQKQDNAFALIAQQMRDQAKAREAEASGVSIKLNKAE